MASLLSALLSSATSSSSTAAMAKASGASKEQVSSLVSSALPLLLQSMASNASDEKGSESLAQALASHAETQGSVSEQIENADTDDGAKIIEHLLGGKTDKVQTTLAGSSGLSSSQVSTILSCLAPALMSSVGKETASAKEEGAEKESSGLDLSSLLVGLVTGKPTASKPAKTGSSGLDLGDILSFAMKDNDGDGQSDVLSVLGKLMTGK